MPIPRIFRLIAIAAGVGLGAAACATSPSTSPSSKAPTDRVLHLSFLQDPGQPPDPDVYYAGQGLLLQDNVYDGLLQYASDTATPRLVPDLATSWTASPDNKVFTLQLRQGVVFHDGTPFTSAAVQPSFARRLAVGQGPSYMVADVASVTTSGPYTVTITLNSGNASFLHYLASAYGPRMMSPTGLAAHAGSDDDQTYLQTHDLGTGPYVLQDVRVGSLYTLRAFPQYWGKKPYFTTADVPVVTDAATQQLQLDKGDLAIVMHDLPESAVRSYLRSSSVRTYSLPTQASDFVYVNPGTAFLTTAANRTALLEAINVKQIYTQVFTGRAAIASQAYPAHMMPAGTATQSIPYRPSALSNLVKTLAPGQRTLTIGYDSSSPDNQLVANLLSAQLNPLGLTVKVQSYQTSQIFGWTPPGNPQGAPDVLLAGGWPDAAPPYMWAHISWDPNGGLNYLHCSSQPITDLLPQGLATGSQQVFSHVGELAVATGCFENMVNEDDFMVAQPWLKGVPQAHVVAVPNSLSLAALSA
jgi:peptide/nickel transport system substrate-binding protein